MKPSAFADMQGDVFSFDGYSLEVATLELRDPSSKLVDASPTVVELIVFLLRNRARVVSRVELSRRLWPDVVVNDNALAQHIWAARKAVGDTGRDQRVIKNVRGRGYRWVSSVSEVSGAPEGSEASARSVAGGSSLETSRPAGSRRSRDFVGREDELGWLRGLLGESVAGEGRIALVAGEAGIGKTRLLHELRNLAAAGGLTEVEGRCHDDDGMPPFWPWKQALAELARQLSDEVLRRAIATEGADLARLLPSLRSRLPDIAGLPAREAADDRYYLFRAVVEFLQRAALERPVVVTLDDLHWADLPSLQLLKFLGTHVGASPVLVVGAFRAHELSAEHRRLLDGTARNACVRQRALEGLDAGAVATLLSQSGLEADARTIERLHSLTGGNPLFVAELDGASDAPADTSAVPSASGLERVIARKLSVLSSTALDVARLAAVLGQEFRLADLKRSSEMPADDLARQLQSLVEHRIIEAESEQLSAYRFTHPLVRDSAVRSIDPSERSRLHRRIAEAIELLPLEQSAPRTTEIAHHYLAAAHAGTASKAAEYARRAAERALESAAFEEAVRLYRRALDVFDLIEEPNETSRSRLWLGLGQALRGAAAPPEVVREPFARVAQAARLQNDPELFAEAALGYAGDGPVRLRPLTEMGVVDIEELAYLDRANEMLGRPDSRTKALVLAVLARAMYHATDWQQRDARACEAVAMARRLGDEGLIARTLLVKQQVMRTPHSLEERLADLDEAVAIADSLGARELAIDARHERAWTRVMAGRFDEARRDVHRIARLADELGQKSERRVVDSFELSFAYVRENIDEVEARDLQGLMGRKTAYSGQAYGVRLLMARYHQDRADETIPLLEHFARLFPLSGSWHCALASTYATVGRLADAERQLESIASAGYTTIPRTHDWLSSFCFLANAAQLLGNAPRARELRAILAPFEGHVVVIGVGNFVGGLVSKHLGDLSRVLGDVAEAERCYSVALGLAERMRSPLTSAWIAVEQAQLYIQPEARDALRATALLAATLPIVERIGAGLLLHRAQALATELHGPPLESPDYAARIGPGAEYDEEGFVPGSLSTNGSAGEANR